MLNRLMSFRLLSVGTLLLVSCAGLNAAIKDVVTEYRSAQDFKRIREYFSGEEHTGRRLVTRSQAEERKGLYFIATLEHSVRDLPANSTVRIEVIRPNDREPAIYELALPETRPVGCEIFAGLTGTDWPDESVKPLAWRVSLRDGSGNELDARHSFLWQYEP